MHQDSDSSCTGLESMETLLIMFLFPERMEYEIENTICQLSLEKFACFVLKVRSPLVSSDSKISYVSIMPSSIKRV